MPNYKRVYAYSNPYFFTINTYKRKKILFRLKSRGFLSNVWKEIQLIHPFEDIAFCLMPDSIHCIWKLSENDLNFFVRWNGIIGYFLNDTKTFLAFLAC